jgi:penicillin-binding protein 2
MGVLDYETTHVCNGYYDLLGRKKLPEPDEISKYKTIFKCWKEGGHGKMDLHSAIRESCNVFFYNVGIEVGAEDLARVARKFGLGKVTGIDLLNEKEGLVPNDAWKQSVLREPWYKGETPPLSIGQGYLNVTPIQVVHMINILVNQGLSVPPKLYAGQPNTQPTQLPLNQEFLKRIGDGMVAVVNETGGTASSVRNEDFIIGGKTATSQVVSLETLENMEEEDREERDFQNHGWFVAYAPAEDPEISVIVLVEHGGAGSRAAAPVARKILDFYYNEIHLPRMQAQSRPSSIQSGSKTPYSTLLESAFLQRPKSIRRSFVMMN